MEQQITGTGLALLAGLYAVDSEFNVNEASDVFVHPAFGTSPELAQSGRNGPSIFPTASVGVRLRWQPNPAVYVQTALLDGVPGDPAHPHGTQVRFNRGDSTLLIAETGFSPSQAERVLQATRRRRGVLHPGMNRKLFRSRTISKVAAGYWRYSARFDDVIDVDGSGNPLQRNAYGAYLLAEETLYQEAADAAQGLAVFARYGVANGDAHAVDYSFIAGVRYVGLLAGRSEDELGLGYVRAHAGSKFRRAQQASGLPAATAESAIELTYRAQLRPWLALQPTLQRIINPCFDSGKSAAWVAGVRMEIAF